MEIETCTRKQQESLNNFGDISNINQWNNISNILN